MSLVLEKLTATGNDFLIVDNREDRQLDALSHAARSVWAKKLCDRHFGIGADGLVILEKSAQADLSWDFYNADGSPAEMCGNAARCVGCWHLGQNPGVKSFSLETAVGVIKIEALERNSFAIQMPHILESRFQQEIKMGSQSLAYSYIDSGVPHVVLKMPFQVPEELDKELAQKLRNHSDFKPRGANITFYSPLTDSQIRCVTFERGVEDFTLSCGTGAIAAGYVYFKEVKRGEIQVLVPGGTLTVKYLPQGPQLIGPAIK
ncbi:MAG: diaminopimelate epimerase, partial [Bdellovibrionales bacterium]|nr:diaminopimelate epimerase [Bdellovibrionales bacterium]